MFIKTRKFIGQKIVLPIIKVKRYIVENKKDLVFIFTSSIVITLVLFYLLFFGWYMH